VPVASCSMTVFILPCPLCASAASRIAVSSCATGTLVRSPCALREVGQVSGEYRLATRR